MIDKEKTLLNDSLLKLFKIDQETLASLYNDAGELVDFSAILDADTSRVKKFKSDSDSQYKRGIKEGASKIESALKEKYELDSELQGVELVDSILAKQLEEVKSSGTKDITKHPDYIKLQVEYDKKLKDKDRELEVKLTEKDKEFANVRLFEKVREKALTSLTSRNPILPADPVKAQNWKNTYLEDLKKGKYQEGDNGQIIVLDQEGNAMKNAHGHTVSFDEFEREIADRYFEYPKSTDRSSAGNKATKGTDNISAPRTQEEFEARLKDPSITPKERVELVKNFGEIKK
jgi:hypothetical protein